MVWKEFFEIIVDVRKKYSIISFFISRGDDFVENFDLMWLEVLEEFL